VVVVSFTRRNAAAVEAIADTIGGLEEAAAAGGEKRVM
jgi:hypothetical protein